MPETNSIELSDDFTALLLSYRTYPHSTVTSSTYGLALAGIRKRLDRKDKLFVKNANDIFIPIREVHKTPTTGQFLVTKQNHWTEANVKKWIGDTYEPEPTDLAEHHGSLATKPDPLCRFMYVVMSNPLSS